MSALRSNQRIDLSVVIPAYNESERIGKTLVSVDAFLKKEPYNYEIIVVDDGSSDDTVELVHSHASTVNNLKLLQLSPNQGKGWAVRTGMLTASGRYRLFMDADGSTSIRHWPQMRSVLDEGADVVVGSRHVDGSMIRVRQAPHREVLGHAFRRLVQFLCGLSINDTQNGFKAFTARTAERIFSRQSVSGWAFDVEILTIAKELGYHAEEIPITWIDDDRSRMRFTAMPRMLTDLLQIRLRTVQPQPAYRLGETPRLITLS